MKTRFWKRGISSLLTAVMLMGMLQFPAAAEKGYMALPETAIGQDILDNDLFYIATTMASVEEAGGDIHLLRVARGGDAAETAGVTVKIADVTAKLGKDYVIRVHNENTEIENPEDNQSLLERMEGAEYTQTERKSEEETLAEMENNPEMAEVTNQAYQASVDYLLEASGVEAQLDEKNDGETAADSENQSSQIQYSEDGEIVSTNPIQRAKQIYTGIDAQSQRVTSTTDMMQQMQNMANVLTNAVVGASLQLDFAPGEREKLIEIETINNHVGDGERYFYLILAEPWGSCTNSAACSAAITILDDEVQAPSEVFFSQESYDAENGSVVVEVRREGALNSIAEVKMTTEEITAMQGRDFSKVERHLVFPMGIDHQTVEIPVESRYFDGEKQFAVKLEADTGSNVTQESATVSIAGTKNVELFAANEGSRTKVTNNLSTIRLGSPIDLSQYKYSGHNDVKKYCGTNSYNSGAKQWEMRWDEKYAFRDPKGKVGAVWEFDYSDSLAYAGVQIEWEKSGGCAGAVAVFKNFATSWDDPFNYGQPSYNHTRSMGSDTKTNVFSRDDAFSVLGIYNNSGCEECDWLKIKKITPIMRPFQIKLQAAKPLTFLQADGTYIEMPDFTTAALNGAANDNNAELVVFPGDTITVKQNSGSATTNFTRLDKLNAVGEGEERIYKKKRFSSALSGVYRVRKM